MILSQGDKKMWLLTTFISVAFSIGLFINALLFIPQAIKLYKTKDAKDLSKITFIGFCLIQLTAIAYGFLQDDVILITGYILSLSTCGVVTFMILKYKK
jgi:MtN3 and saliva related transmembrane protein